MYSCNITLQLHLHTNITTGSVTQILNLNQNIRSSYFISSKASFFFPQDSNIQVISRPQWLIFVGGKIT